MITTVTVLVALGVLVWGFVRARPYGKLGLLAWLQSVVLMVPWLLFFGLFSVGIYLNLIGILVLIVLSTSLYIVLGRQVRALAQSGKLPGRASTIANAASESTSPDAAAGEMAPDAPAPSASVEEPQPNEVSSIPAEDLKLIQGIFGIDTYFVTETIPYQEGVILKGNLRGDLEKTYATLSDSLKQRVGDRYRLFLVENQDGKPVIVVLPSSNDPKPATLPQQILAVLLFIATVVTSLETGGLLQGFDFLQTPERYAEALPVAVGILAILVGHEVGHRVLARRYQVRISLPFFIPTLQIGSFGALTRFESVLPNRTALFDIAFAGPAVGGGLSLLLLLLGLVLSHAGSLFQVPSQFFQGSILVGTLARVVLGNELQQPIVDVHPLVILGWLGLVITALSLMPAGQLDGGRIVQAIYGRKVAGRATVATLIFLAIASLVNPLALYWAIVIVFLQRDLERPSLNDLSEPDDARAGLGLLALFLMVTTLLPLTPSLAGRLGIGG